MKDITTTSIRVVAIGREYFYYGEETKVCKECINKRGFLEKIKLLKTFY